MRQKQISTDIHEEIDRLVLRSRWIRWLLRHWKGSQKKYDRKFAPLSDRLTRVKPTFEERNDGFHEESFDCD